MGFAQFGESSFALLSHSHCWHSHRCRIRTVGIRTVDPFAPLAFALLASHWCRSHWCLSHSCRDTALMSVHDSYRPSSRKADSCSSEISKRGRTSRPGLANNTTNSTASWQQLVCSGLQFPFSAVGDSAWISCKLDSKIRRSGQELEPNSTPRREIGALQGLAQSIARKAGGPGIGSTFDDETIYLLRHQSKVLSISEEPKWLGTLAFWNLAMINIFEEISFYAQGKTDTETNFIVSISFYSF